jgi:uncharacterized protein (DUF2147 family)
MYMKKTTLLLIAAIFLLPSFLLAQPGKIVGKWYTIDEDGNRKSLVAITRTSAGIYEGVIEKLLTGDPNRRCVECSGTDKDKPIAGMKIIRGLKADGEKLTGGTILDPANGKIYNCTMTYDKKTGNLKVRGSLDRTGIIGRNQTWLKAED